MFGMNWRMSSGLPMQKSTFNRTKVLSPDKICGQLIPWSNDAANRIIVARRQMQASSLPETVRLEKRPLSGKRIISKKGRLYLNPRSTLASWPEPGLNEISVLKLACVISGHVDFQLGRQAVLCGPGHFIFIPPGLPHPDGSRNITDTSKSTFCEILYFRLLPDALLCWLSRYEAGENPRRQSANYLITHAHTLQQFRILMEETVSDSPASLDLSEKLLQSFLRFFDREIQAKRYLLVSMRSDERSQEHQFQESGNFSEELHRYIQSHLCERPTLERTARGMYLSRSQFSRRVRAETGKTFVELLNEHRIETAKELLRDTDWTINSITSFIGFKTPHHFQSLFREQTGMTPNTYRQQNR
jgi:AraC-like DNA-binding protein